eukprot:760853-Hanusia_phi.AAC.4
MRREAARAGHLEGTDHTGHGLVEDAVARLIVHASLTLLPRVLHINEVENLLQVARRFACLEAEKLGQRPPAPLLALTSSTRG